MAVAATAGSQARRRATPQVTAARWDSRPHAALYLILPLRALGSAVAPSSARGITARPFADWFLAAEASHRAPTWSLRFCSSAYYCPRGMPPCARFASLLDACAAPVSLRPPA